jgi:hypothetical protein
MEKNKVRFRFFGDLTKLSPELQALVAKADEIASRIDGFQANICLNYGGRDDIVQAARRYARYFADGKTTGELTEEGTVDTMKPGEYHLVFTVTAKDPEYLQTVEKTAERTITVQDTQLPEITLSEETVLIKEGSEYHPEENVAKVSDPVDGELEYTVETELDPAVPGEYEVTVTAADHNGNTAEKVFAVTVKSRPQFTGNAGIIFDFLTNEMGLNDAAACGVMANIRYESTFDPEAESYYYGLCQWGGGRRALLVSWCSENGYEYNTVEGQLAFLNYELNESYPAALNGLLDAEDSAEGANEAAVIFCRIYEGAASLGGRPSLAEDYYNS